MSGYQVCIIRMGQEAAIEHVNFDNKEDAEHYAKNKSQNDDKHSYVIKKNDRGEFSPIKAYQQGQVVDIEE